MTHSFRRATQIVACVSALAIVGACSDSGGGSNPPPPPPPPAPPPPPPPTGGNVTVSGTFTYDFVPFASATGGLDYGATEQRPARGVVVQAVDASGSVLATTSTDDAGFYSLETPDNTDVRIRGVAELSQVSVSGGASYNFVVQDNTNNFATYAVAGALANTGASNSTRNLNAASGWTGASYTQPRAAAPFALLDDVFITIQDIIAVDNDIAFPTLRLLWSPRNTAASGEVEDGDIGTSSFTRLNFGTAGAPAFEPVILILGDANNDTDEYDRHVVIHEFGHYFENELARADSPGGPHTLDDRLDARLAFSEGFANAFSGLILDDPIYKDSFGAGQSRSFFIDLESNSTTNSGWYAEDSVMSIIFDLIDANNDGVDNETAGFDALVRVFLNPDYRDSPAPTTIYNFATIAETDAAFSPAAIDTLLTSQDIFGRGLFGAGETNSAGVPRALPVTKMPTIGGGPVEICSVDDEGTFNKLGVRSILAFDNPVRQNLTFRMERISGAANRDPDFFIQTAPDLGFFADSGNSDVENFSVTLDPGSYLIDAYDFNNISDANTTPGDACYDFTIN